jgi:circadian clock protein KaiB
MYDARSIRLFLFVSNDAPRSVMAIENIQHALAELADHAFALEIVNVYDDPERALSHRVLVTPTLLAPATERRLVGDLSEEGKLYSFLRGLPVGLATTTR